MEEQKIKVLALLPMELPKEIELDSTLEAMQNFVGGLIECITLSNTGSEVTLVCNDTAPLLQVILLLPRIISISAALLHFSETIDILRLL